MLNDAGLISSKRKYFKVYKKQSLLVTSIRLCNTIYVLLNYFELFALLISAIASFGSICTLATGLEVVKV